MFVLPNIVRCGWRRHNLERARSSIETLQAKVAQEGSILTEAHVIALERAKMEKLAVHEIKTIIRFIWVCRIRFIPEN
jgi:hypothetical protein